MLWAYVKRDDFLHENYELLDDTVCMNVDVSLMRTTYDMTKKAILIVQILIMMMMVIWDYCFGT